MVLTAGPEQSNLCALTAAACAQVGLDCELVLNSSAVNQTGGHTAVSARDKNRHIPDPTLPAINNGKIQGTVCYLHSGGLGSLFAQY